ncbi:Co2+/Mg2+ efflux protein ApaG [Terasakiella sp. SH-1]|uniref:Co2+/Mg2+ efflux protein ApaG n=1 Tax=Terasakiella sp. SH-1 TaxID=2560057 RepID=UPI0010740DB2|nr:Co2+/Mg2+ efflux protein ApaG [Terasakiella sp. SH-1]
MKFEETTRMVTVAVEPIFLEDESDPEKSTFVWAYHIEIKNDGYESIQLISRYWKITDGLGRTQEVRGEGVVGEQPLLEPGGSYEYTSGVPLQTPSGFMGGSYEMISSAGERLHVTIPTFLLDSPFEAHTVN